MNQPQYVTLSNGRLEVRLCSFGASIRHIAWRGVIMTYACVDDQEFFYSDPFFGKTIGPVCGRLKKGKLGSFTYPKSEGENALHSGSLNFGVADFAFEKKGHEVTFRRAFFEEDGYPCDIDVEVTYRLEGDKLILIQRAVPSKDIPLNVTNHAYFTLGEDACDLTLTMDAPSHAIYDDELIPEKLVKSEGYFDFSKGKKVGEGIETFKAAPRCGDGYDHLFLLPKKSLHLEGSRFAMDLTTDREAVQLFLRRRFDYEEGPLHSLAIEPQDNQLALHEGPYSQTITYAFSQKEVA